MPDHPDLVDARSSRAVRVAFVVGVGCLLLFGATVVWLVLAIGDGEAVTGPGYVELDDAERAAVMTRASEVGTLLDEWWGTELDRRGVVALVVGDRLTDGDDGVRCDGDEIVPDDDLLDNAYMADCREGPAIAIDPATFRGSDVALLVTLAHEWGHVVQAADPPLLDEYVHDPDSVYAETELQADCYAGAWAGVHLTEGELTEAERELRAIADGPEVADDDPDGHGTAAERAAAFWLGVDGGVDACLPAVYDAR